jgi:hypothetical protein
MAAPTVLLASEEKDDGSQSPLVAAITAADIANIRAANSRSNTSPQSIPASIWRYVATRAGFSSTITHKDQVVEAVLSRPNEPSVNLLLNLIKSGSITRNSTPADFQQLSEDLGLEQSAVS